MTLPEAILFVDDEQDLWNAFEFQFREESENGRYHLLFAVNGREALELLEAHPDISIVVADIRMPELDGMEMLEEIRRRSRFDERYARVRVIVLTAFGDSVDIRQMVRSGAVDFLPKPYDLDELRSTIERIRAERQIPLEAELFLGHSAAIQRIKEQVRQLASRQVNIMLEGETGSGKSLLAQYIHLNSARRKGPFVDLHCAAIPPALLESELFGHVKGAFTDARQNRSGKFRLAHQGTLFLDEINSIPPAMQLSLLKVLEEQRFFPLGSEEAVQVDVRLIAATQEPLAELVRQQRFREDLYHRLNIITITIPPLRERRDDIPLLARALLVRLNQKHHSAKTLSRPALKSLIHGEWSGNVRALANALENAVLLAPGDEIQAADLPEDPLHKHVRAAVDVPAASPETWIENLLRQEGCDVPREMQQALLRAAWKEYGGNKTRIAERLGMARGTLYRLLRDLGLD